MARQFRKYYGLTIGEFVRQSRRVEFARNRLRYSDMPIVEIALEAGFAHQSHFRDEVFKKLMGVTPRQYSRRRRHRPSKKTITFRFSISIWSLYCYSLQ